MIDAVDLSPLMGMRVIQVETGTIISDPLGKSPDVTVDDKTVAVSGNKMFVTEKVFNRLHDAVPEAKP